MRILSVCLMLLGTLAMQAQEDRFFVPKEIKTAYEEGTRSMNGAPGPGYWQNLVDYDIDVIFDPATRLIDGAETVTYTNNSPDDLTSIVVRTYYDVFRKGNIRNSPVNPEDIGEGTQIDRLVINGEEYNIDNPRQVQRSGTNMLILLSEPLLSGESLTMDVEWEQYVPLTNRRTGTYDSTSFFVAYWYPQMAVYDDVFGWDNMNYTLQTEFYNNLANFDVSITAPEDFTIWATGLLQNPEDVLPAEQLKRYQQALTATDETVNIIRAEDINAGYENAGTTWQFTAEEVTDFAFATSDHYLWDAATQRVADRDVVIESVFPIDQAGDFPDLTQIQRKIMRHFSEDIPGVPYPYEAFTTFIGLFGGGMEFPMMANNAGPGLGVTIHEMFHTYFPMYVRINERRFAFMDEGWAAYVDNLVEKRFFEEEPGYIFDMYKGGVQGVIGSYSDLPLITSTQFMDDSNYGYASYPLPAFFYSILHHYLGDERFLQAYRTYIRRWAKKAPTPYDFIYTFEDVTNEDLSWLFKPWFFEFGYPDVAIASYKKGKLEVENTGTRPMPLQIEVTYQDGSTDVITETAGVWKEKSAYKTKIKDYKNMASFTVNKSLADLTTLNNFYPPLSNRYQEEGIAINEIVGSYTVMGFNLKVMMEEEEGVLKLVIPAASFESYLAPGAADEFDSLDGSAKVTVNRDDAGTVTGMTVEAFGYNLPAVKD